MLCVLLENRHKVGSEIEQKCCDTVRPLECEIVTQYNLQPKFRTILNPTPNKLSQPLCGSTSCLRENVLILGIECCIYLTCVVSLFPTNRELFPLFFQSKTFSPFSFLPPCNLFPFLPFLLSFFYLFFTLLFYYFFYTHTQIRFTQFPRLNLIEMSKLVVLECKIQFTVYAIYWHYISLYSNHCKLKQNQFKYYTPMVNPHLCCNSTIKLTRIKRNICKFT